IMMSGDDDLIRAELGAGRAERLGIEGAARFVTDPDRCRQFGRAIGLVIEPERRPVLWHCSAGKDRAGWMATAIALMLGVDRNQATAHYLESNRGFGLSQAAEGFLANRDLLEVVRPLLEVQASYIESSFGAMDEAFGGIEGYLHDGLGLEPQAVEAFRSAVLA
ncbi:MAG: tyrosine-protein phosphatase, partial [Acidimicrobiales bacterium]|nr:tyrosine-protein phosphatase [Acidimicrobiales bacterium]